MARKLMANETQLFAEAAAAEQPSDASDSEAILAALARRRDAVLELTPESSAWFGDQFLLPPDFRH